MQVKTSELLGTALDWAVAKCLNYVHADGNVYLNCWAPSTNWGQGGPIIERERISTCWEGTTWVATLFNKNCGETWYGHHYGSTPLIAAMRCYVSSKLGNAVEIPDKFLE